MRRTLFRLAAGVALVLGIVAPADAQNLRQIFSGRAPSLTATSATRYNAPFAPIAWATAEANARSPVPLAGTMRHLVIRLTAAPGTDISAIYTIHKNGSATDLAVTISGTATEAANLVDDVTFAEDDTIVLVRTTSGGSPATTDTLITTEYETETTTGSVYGGGLGAPSTSSVRYGNPITPKNASLWSTLTDDTTNQALWAVDGTITRWAVRLATSPGSGRSYVYALYKNGTKQDGTGGTVDTRITVADSATTGSASFSLALEPGDRLMVESTPSGSPTSAAVSVGVAFTATTAGEAHFGGSSGASTAGGNATRYNVFPGLDWPTTESDREALVGPTSVTLSQLRILVSGSSDRSVTVRRNQASPSGTPTVSISGGTLSAHDATGSVTLSDGDVWSIQTIATNANTVRVNWAVVQTMGAPPPMAAIFNALLISP